MSSDARWYEAEEETAYEVVFRLVEALSDLNRPDKERMLRCARLYDPSAAFLGAEIETQRAPWPYQDLGGGCVFNLVQSCIDTVRSMVGKNRPRASFQTDGAKFSVARRAKDLTKFCEAKAHQVEVYEDLEQTFFEGTQVGSGFVKVFARDGMVDVEPVPWEAIEVDPNEAMFGEPRSMHEIRFVDRGVLAAMFPEAAEFIEQAPEPSQLDDGYRRFNSYRQIGPGLVAVIESWHLPSGKDSGDGRHGICMEGRTLLWEPWTRSRFPIVKFDWQKRPRGYWGIGLAEQLAGIQNRINRLYAYIARCHNLANTFLRVGPADATLKLKASGGAGASPVQVLVTKDPNVPAEFITPQLVQPEVYQHINYLKEMGYQLAGISENAARSEVPRQFESAVAVNTYNDIQTQRFSIQAQRYERLALTVFELMIEEQKELGDNKAEAYYRSGNVARRLKWKDVNLERDMYVMSIEASSLLGRSPAARQQMAIELGNAGLFDRDELRGLIGHPDLERTMSLKNAALEHAEAIVERLLDGEYRPPEPLDNIPVCMTVVTNAFLKAKDEDAPEEILDGFRLWLKQATDIVNMAPPPPDPSMMPPQPPMPPAPPPVNSAAIPGLPAGM